jgi:uncharacterized repeat protein (TIGR02543 family)
MVDSAYTFDGWFAPAATVAFDFTTPITADITLTAKWTAPTVTPINVSGSSGTGIVAKAVTYVKANAGAGTYTLFIDADVDCVPQTLDAADVKLTIVGIGGERKINTSSQGALFIVGDTGKTGISLTVGNNITLVGRSASGNGGANNDNCVARVENGAAFTMLDGSKVTGNNSSSSSDSTSAAVYVTGSGSVFTMEGGSVSGNTGTGRGGDVYKSQSTSMSMSGTAMIGTLTLSNTAQSNSNFVTVASGLTGGVTSLNLRGATNVIADVPAYYYNATTPKTVLQAADGYTLTAADVAKFTLGNFMTNTGIISTQVISTTYKIADSGADMGKLVTN